jgi:VWFA-related protein
MVFAGHAKLILNFTKDKQLAAKVIREADRQGVGSETDPSEAVFQAASYLKNSTSRESRRIIIAISDDVSTRKATSLSKSKTNHELLESGSVVCGLFFDSIYKTKGEPPTDPYSGVNQTILISGETNIIKSFVDETGGVAIEADQQNVKEGFIRLLERLRTRYSLGYSSSNQNRNGKFRRIKLAVPAETEKRENGVAIIARKGYYAQSGAK